MLKTLLAEVKQYKKASILTPASLWWCEVVMEVLIPMMMAAIIDSGVEKGERAHYLHCTGRLQWPLMAMLSLACGACARTALAAEATSGFARNLRRAMFRKYPDASPFPTSTNTPRPGWSPV